MAPPITIIGMGVSSDDLTLRQRSTIETADILVGGRRLLEPFSQLPCRRQVIDKDLKRLSDFLAREMADHTIVVLTSGDPLFYGCLALQVGKICLACLVARLGHSPCGRLDVLVGVVREVAHADYPSLPSAIGGRNAKAGSCVAGLLGREVIDDKRNSHLKSPMAAHLFLLSGHLWLIDGFLASREPHWRYGPSSRLLNLVLTDATPRWLRREQSHPACFGPESTATRFVQSRAFSTPAADVQDADRVTAAR